jgi:cytidylate kinase
MTDFRVIAIDGPAGAGKSTVSRACAEALGLEMLDSGAMYRAATLTVLEAGIALDDSPAIAALLERTSIELDDRVLVNGRDVSAEIRTPEVTAATSGAIALNPEVRTLLIRRQREWMMARGGGVAEGRDMTTTVFPDAPVRIFLYADPRVRAARRGLEEAAENRLGPDRDLGSELSQRDSRDATLGRVTQLDQVPAGVTVIDSSEISINEVVQRIVALAREAGIE